MDIIFGVVRGGLYVADVSTSLLGAKQHATRNGYHIVAKRNVNSGFVTVLAIKSETGKWEAQ